MSDEPTEVVTVTAERLAELLAENERLRAERDRAIKHCVYMTGGYSDQEIASDVAEATGIDLDTVLAAAGLKAAEPTGLAIKGACPCCKSINIKHYRSGEWFVNQCSSCGYASGFAK